VDVIDADIWVKQDDASVGKISDIPDNINSLLLQLGLLSISTVENRVLFNDDT
jgi:hypothetical protein